MRLKSHWPMILLAALALAIFREPPLGQESATSRGMALMGQGKFEEALPVLGQEAAADPGNVRVGMAQVDCLIQLSRWREAMGACEKLGERFPRDPEVAILKGDCLFLLFLPAKALGAYSSALPDSRWGPTALAKAATAALALGDDDLALRMIREARAQGKPLIDGTLQIEYRIETDAFRKAAALRDLLVHNPENASLKEEKALFEALSAKGQPGNRPPDKYPSQARIKEIYREPCIPIRLNDERDTWLAFDTGSESVLLNEDLVNRMKLPGLSVSSYRGWGYQGPQETRFVYVRKLAAAGRALENIAALVNKRDVEFWTKKGGYIGLNPFIKDVVLYDRRKGGFALWPPGTSHEELLGGPGVGLTVLWYRGLPLVPVTLQDGEPHPFLLDTGAPYTLLDRERSARVGIRVNSGKYGNVHGLGMSGAFSSSVAEGVIIGVGGYRYIRPLALVTEIPQSFPVPVYGILGRDILNDFKVVFDGPGARVTLRPYSGDLPVEKPAPDAAGNPDHFPQPPLKEVPKGTANAGVPESSPPPAATAPDQHR